jgi:hypothetical protein
MRLNKVATTGKYAGPGPNAVCYRLRNKRRNRRECLQIPPVPVKLE